MLVASICARIYNSFVGSLATSMGFSAMAAVGTVPCDCPPPPQHLTVPSSATFLGNFCSQPHDASLPCAWLQRC